MAILLFERTATCSFFAPWNGHVSEDEAAAMVKREIRNGLTDPKFSSDYFQELGEVNAPEQVNFKCYAGPFKEPSRRDIEILPGADGDRAMIRFETKQNCIYIANGVDVDTATTMACVAAIADDVEQSITVDASIPHRWELSGPDGIPQEILTRCIPAFMPASALRKPHKQNARTAG